MAQLLVLVCSDCLWVMGIFFVSSPGANPGFLERGFISIENVSISFADLI